MTRPTLFLVALFASLSPSSAPPHPSREPIGSGSASEPPEFAGRRVLVIIPAYNERGPLRHVIERVRTSLPEADIVVVDDGSVDGTASVASAEAVQFLRLPFNCGIGTAMQLGYQFARDQGHDVAIQIDGDGQHDPAQAPRLLAPIFAGSADVTIGSRFLGAGGYASSAIRRFGIKWFASVISLIVGARVTDPTSGFRAANRKAICFFAEEYPADYPEPEVLVYLSQAKFRLMEVPVTMSPRVSGRSSITTFRSVYYMAKVTLAIAMTVLRRPHPRGEERG